jgi:hypothetical protein
MKPNHGCIVKVGLTDMQDSELRRMAAAQDIPQSIFMRHLLINEIRRQADHEAMTDHDAMPATGQHRA